MFLCHRYTQHDLQNSAHYLQSTPSNRKTPRQSNNGNEFSGMSAPFLDLSTSSPAGRLFEPGGAYHSNIVGNQVRQSPLRKRSAGVGESFSPAPRRIGWD